MKFLNPTPFAARDRTIASLEEEALMQGSVADQLQSHFRILKPAEDHSKGQVQISFHDISVGFVPTVPIPVRASRTSHSYVASSFLGHDQFRENS